jgi:hypothetical protein
MIGGLADAAERNAVVIFNENLKVITSVQIQLLPDWAGQNDLAIL